MIYLWSGPFSVQVPPAVYPVLPELLSRAKIVMQFNDEGEIHYVGKGTDRLWFRGGFDAFHGYYSVGYSPAGRWRSIVPEIERILFASGSHELEYPSNEIYVSPSGVSSSESIIQILISRLGDNALSVQPTRIRVRGGIDVFHGPAADPLTGSPTSYVVLRYSFWKFAPTYSWVRKRNLHILKRSLLEAHYVFIPRPK